MPTEPAPDTEEEGPETDRSGLFRRNGLPCRALVDRQGDLWVVSSEQEQVDRIALALALRFEKVHELCIDAADMPPLPA